MIILNSIVTRCEYSVDESGDTLIVYTEHPDLGKEEIRIPSLQSIDLNARFLRMMKAMIGYRLLTILADDINGSCTFNFGQTETEISLLLQNICVSEVLSAIVTPS